MSNISYKGNVTIKIMNGKKVIKVIKKSNSGTTWLFKVLASAVIGSNESNNMPHYLDVKNSGNTSLISNKVSFTAKRISYFEENSTSGYKAILDAFIPRRSLINPDTSAVKYIEMYSTATGDTKLANIELDDPLVLSGQNNYAIEWEMCFMNGSVNDEVDINSEEGNED